MRAVHTLEQLQQAARTHGIAVGPQVDGWSFVMSSPEYIPEKPFIDAALKLGANPSLPHVPMWTLTAKRVNGRPPTPGQLANLRRLVVKIGGPDREPNPQMIQGTWLWLWAECH